MLVCHCFAVRECEVRDAVARGARSAHEVARACRAGSRCGGCRPLIEELLASPAPTHFPAPPAAEAATRAHPRSSLGA
jgi:bacterioferritin-associated ferredoxin